MKLEGQDRFHSELRIEARSDVTALNLLSGNEAVSLLETAIESMSPRDERNFLQGYLLAVASPLTELLHFVITQTQLLGLQHDSQVNDWWSYRMPSRGESLLTAVSNHSSDLGRILHVFNDLRTALRESSKGLSNTLEAIKRCRGFAELLEQLFVDAELVSVDTGEKLGDRHLAFKHCLVERVLDYAGRLPSATRLAYRWVWMNERGQALLDDGFIIESETHLSDVQLLPRSGEFPYAWGKGYWFGINLILDLEEVGLVTRPEPDYADETWGVWYSELESRIRRSTPDGSWPTHRYGLERFPQIAANRMFNQLEAKVVTVSPSQRLSTTLGPDEVHLMSDAGIADAFQLDVILTGAVAKSEGSAVRVLLLNHAVADDPREWVSIGIRLPQYGTLGSNFSTWYLFYKMYHLGDVFDSDVARNISAVKQLLQRFKKDIEVEEIGGLDSQDFLPLCVSPAFQAMRDVSRDAVEVNADLRAGNSELLVGLWMTSEGYRPVRISFNHVSLGKREFDAIGVMDGQCLVVEVKGADLVDDELQRAISKFEEKVEYLCTRLPVLASTLGYEGLIDSVSGLFVFLGDLDRFTPADPQVTLWGFNDFVSKLKAVGTPSRIVGLLDKSNIIHTVDAKDFLDDLFFTSSRDS